MNNWSPEFEMDYVHHTSKEQLTKRLSDIIDIFRVRHVRFIDMGTIMDVGCGPLGGVAAMASVSSHRIAVDPLMSTYEPLGWVPEGVECRNEFSHELSQPDNSVNSLFCLECLDHCDDMEKFHQSQRELARVLAPGGEFCFMLPARAEPRDGHPCNPPGVHVAGYFVDIGLTILETRFCGKDDRQKEGTWLKMTKAMS